MRPLFHPHLINGAGGDPALYVDFQFHRRALLFDLGDVHALSPRKILRLSDIFVSHTHMDHFIGFDGVLRICLGRDKRLRLFGPPGFIGQVGHKLKAYSWNLVHRYANDLILDVTEAHPDGSALRTRFRCRNAFLREDLEALSIEEGVLRDETEFRVRCTFLDHDIPCLAYVVEEKAHLNVWKNRVALLGIPLGAWLRELKLAVLSGDPDDTPFAVRWQDGGKHHERVFRLGDLKESILQVAAGQKLGYVTDCAWHADNARRIVDLVKATDLLFIEAMFSEADRDHAAAKQHLTARQAGELARAAAVRKVIPFHFSARYGSDSQELVGEVERAYQGE